MCVVLLLRFPVFFDEEEGASGPCKENNEQRDAHCRAVRKPSNGNDQHGNRGRNDAGHGAKDCANNSADNVAHERDDLRGDRNRADAELQAEPADKPADEAEDPGQCFVLALKVVKDLVARDGATLKLSDSAVRTVALCREKVGEGK